MIHHPLGLPSQKKFLLHLLLNQNLLLNLILCLSTGMDLKVVQLIALNLHTECRFSYHYFSMYNSL